MFKKLKEKITEEVKSSPQRFAEIRQSVTDRLQNNSNSDDNFFSIGDDDASATNSSDHGFSSVSLVSPSQDTIYRRNSNSSIASDVSFLPRYESSSMYHLQSDLDASASELEDNVSTASSQLGHLSKEQIYSAFQKSQMRYHKYRGRYTDLARHYKDLERENAKMKSVLVETQDKAIRRVTELKEQCNLEQKAKAHLESALRDELDEKNFKIETLETKIDLLQGGNNSDLLVNMEQKESTNQTENLENLPKYLNDARKEIEILNEKNQEMKANLIVFQSKEQEYKTKVSNLEKEINQYYEREKENNLKLAQSKMELHNEILSKDAEISNLKNDNDVLKQSLEAFETETRNIKLENLQSQNKKLIERVETLTHKCNTLETELLKVEKYKLDIQNLEQTEETLKGELLETKNLNQNLEENCTKLSEENLQLKENLEKEKKHYENQIMNFREEAKKGLLSLEPKIREKLQNEHLQQEENLKKEFACKVEELTTNNSSIKEMKLKLFERDDIIKKTIEELDVCKRELSKKVDEYCSLEKNHLDLIEDSEKLRNTISNFEKEKSISENYEEKMPRLDAHISTLQQEVKSLESRLEKKEEEIVRLSKEILDLEQLLSERSQKLKLLEEKYETIHLESSESKILTLKVEKLEEEKKSLLEQFEAERKMFNEMLDNQKDLEEKEEIIGSLRETLKKGRIESKHLEESLENAKKDNIHLCEVKLNLEKEMELLKEEVRLLEEKNQAMNLDRNECGILELKLRNLEEENRTIQETFELERKSFAKDVERIRRHLSNTDENNQENLAESQLLEKSNLNNVLRDKLYEIKHLSEAKEKENVYLSKENLNLQNENANLFEKLRLLEERCQSIELEHTESKLLELKVCKLEEENHLIREDFENERKMFNDLLKNHKELKEKEEQVEQLENRLVDTRKEMAQLKDSLDKEKEENVKLLKIKLMLEQETDKLKEKIRLLEERDQANQLDKNECGLLEMKLQKLELEKKDLIESFDLERKNFSTFCKENSRNENKIKELMDQNFELKDSLKRGKDELETLSSKLKSEAERYENLYKECTENLEKINLLDNRIKEQEEENKKLLEKLEKGEAVKTQNVEKLTSLNKINDKLRNELEGKNTQVSELSKNIAHLNEVTQKQTTEFNNLLERTKQLDSVLEKLRSDSAEAIKMEKEKQNELTLKIEGLQSELDAKSKEYANLNTKLTELEDLYNLEKNNYKKTLMELELLQNKLENLQSLQESIAIIGEDKKAIENQLVDLITKKNEAENEKLSLENKLKEVEDGFKTKNNELLQNLKIMEQNLLLIKEEKESLLEEIKSLRGKIEDLNQENNDLKILSSKINESNQNLFELKTQNERLETERDNLRKEMIELSLRVNQISSDNANVLEENQSLIHDNEELKIKLEYFENEKTSANGEYEKITKKLSDENLELSNTVEEIKRQLTESQLQNLELINDKNLLTSNEIDISKIQQDFYEIKEKCDSLFVENKNLKTEYTKLEEKCNGFSKIKNKLETQISELEHHYTEILHEKQLLQDEVQELKISPMNLKTNPSKLDQLEILKEERSFQTGSSNKGGDEDKYQKEINILRDKLTQYKSLDITNKSSIEFYENELQKMKITNEKLNRKLDETIVTLNHCADLSSSTEVEYLKNVLYNYMLGKESLVLARVIAAVCKFDPQQTETVLQKEHQKQTLLGQLGLI